MLRDVRGPHAADQQQRERDVEEADREGGAGAIVAGLLQRAVDRAAVEPADRREVDQVKQEPGVGERAQQLRAARRGPARRGGDAAGRRPGEGDQRVVPRVALLVSDQHVGADERDEGRQRHLEPLQLGRHEVAHLVDQDQQHEADAELPAPDQRIRADGDEDPEELEDDEAELDREPDQGGDRRPDPPHDPAPVVPVRMDRLVVAPRLAHRGEQRALLLDRQVLEAPLDVVLAHDPCPIHSSPPSYTSFFQSGTLTFRVSIASAQALSAAWRCAAETAITTLVSPIPTRPTRWWIATSIRSCLSFRDSARSAMLFSAMPSYAS